MLPARISTRCVIDGHFVLVECFLQLWCDVGSHALDRLVFAVGRVKGLSTPGVGTPQKRMNIGVVARWLRNLEQVANLVPCGLWNLFQ